MGYVTVGSMVKLNLNSKCKSHGCIGTVMEFTSTPGTYHVKVTRMNKTWMAWFVPSSAMEPHFLSDELLGDLDIYQDEFGCIRAIGD